MVRGERKNGYGDTSYASVESFHEHYTLMQDAHNLATASYFNPSVSKEPKTSILTGVAQTQVQDPALGLGEPHEVHTGLLLELVQVPLDGIPSLRNGTENKATSTDLNPSHFERFQIQASSALQIPIQTVNGRMQKKATLSAQMAEKGGRNPVGIPLGDSRNIRIWITSSNRTKTSQDSVTTQGIVDAKHRAFLEETQGRSLAGSSSLMISQQPRAFSDFKGQLQHRHGFSKRTSELGLDDPKGRFPA
ncbi:hypothetical protein llap_12441 [Limosa lapponica baueri]|uniref:Uncharacterized protein n=1 Tax=Limosa lapponica baueri TaxID=1758121 RepID=A0A2I0TTZ1_LIMLA|nr:hypothetical protein llap_12441 [Limosa lapponica baueri]